MLKKYFNSAKNENLFNSFDFFNSKVPKNEEKKNYRKLESSFIKYLTLFAVFQVAVFGKENIANFE